MVNMTFHMYMVWIGGVCLLCICRTGAASLDSSTGNDSNSNLRPIQVAATPSPSSSTSPSSAPTKTFSASTSCLEDSSDEPIEFTVYPTCELDTVLAAVYQEMIQEPSCVDLYGDGTSTNVDIPRAAVMRELAYFLDVDSYEAVEPAVRAQCQAALDKWHETNVPFQAITNEGEQFDKEFFDGGTHYNEQRQTAREVGFGGGFETQLLKQEGYRFNRIYSNNDLGAENRGIEWPGDYIDNFENCELRAAMCCWVQDRQANDNNGHCDDPYDLNCVSEDPADNTDLCYVDMARSPYSNHVEGGFAVFEDEIEGDVHCHGMAWSNDTYDARSRYIGNNLFYISFYDHLYKRGYIRNVPGAPMCSCLEKAPVVTRSDCTQLDVEETIVFSYDNESQVLQAMVSDVEVDFNSCQGRNKNNDLYEYYAKLSMTGHATAEEFEKVGETLVQPGNCPKAIVSFLDTQDLQPIPVTLTTDKLEYLEGDTVTINFAVRRPEEYDEIEIYPAHSIPNKTQWNNVDEIYTCGSQDYRDCSDIYTTEGTFQLPGSDWEKNRMLRPGTYVAMYDGWKKGFRATSEEFTIKQQHAAIWTDKLVYHKGENIQVFFENDGHRADDWIALYSTDTDVSDGYSSGYKDWIYGCGDTSCEEQTMEGNFSLPGSGWNYRNSPGEMLEPGEYFFVLREKSWSQSMIWARSDVFTVISVINPDVSITTDRLSYYVGQTIDIELKMDGFRATDWVGIYHGDADIKDGSYSGFIDFIYSCGSQFKENCTEPTESASLQYPGSDWKYGDRLNEQGIYRFVVRESGWNSQVWGYSDPIFLLDLPKV